MGLYSWQSHALVTVGGYVPFGLSTQKTADGKRNTFTLKPSLGLNTSMPLKGIKHFFLPELGLALSGTPDNEDYTKTTVYALMDLGYPMTSSSLLRYGAGVFATVIKGKGGSVRRRNGTGTDTFARPSKTTISYNMTLNLGLEQQLYKSWSLRLETFVFSMFNNRARDISYMATINYYL